jgi:hypothetical protein
MFFSKQTAARRCRYTSRRSWRRSILVCLLRVRAIIKARVNVIEGSNCRRLSRAFPSSHSLSLSHPHYVFYLSLTLFSLPLSRCVYVHDRKKNFSCSPTSPNTDAAYLGDVGLLVTTYPSDQPPAISCIAFGDKSPCHACDLYLRLRLQPTNNPFEAQRRTVIEIVVTSIFTWYSTVITILLRCTIARVFVITFLFYYGS